MLPLDLRKSGKILRSKIAIQVYVGGDEGPISDYMFKKYITLGMPARYEAGGGGWIADTDNLDEFFRSYTRISMAAQLPHIPDDPNGGSI